MLKINSFKNALSYGEPCSQCSMENPFCLNKTFCVDAKLCLKAEFKCDIPRKKYLLPVLSIIRKPPIKKDCYNRRLECSNWLSRGYCYLHTVQRNCPVACGLCILDNSSLNDICGEPKSRSLYCHAFKLSGLCTQSRDAQIFCPQTCHWSQCTSPITTAPSLNFTVISTPESYFSSSSTYKPTINQTVSTETSASSSSSSPSTIEISISTSTADTESPSCKQMKSLCKNLYFRRVCRITCKDTLKTPIISTSTKNTTPNLLYKTQDPACPAEKFLCVNPHFRKFCWKTCQSDKYQTESTTPSTRVRSDCVSPIKESKQCKTMKDMCSNSEIRKLCKITCGVCQIDYQTTSVLPTEFPGCIKMKPDCFKDEIKKICPITCNKI